MNTNQPGGMPPDIHLLAGEYVLGTLPAARRRENRGRRAEPAQYVGAATVFFSRSSMRTRRMRSAISRVISASSSHR